MNDSKLTMIRRKYMKLGKNNFKKIQNKIIID